MKKEEGLKQIERLVKKYNDLTAAQRKKYNESMTCKDFILPLFQSLGWDVYNNFGNEVTSENQVSGKRVDYAFYVNDIIKFFVEAKKFDVDLREKRWAEQVIMYSWHKSVPWAILTDFESIKVFNAEWDEPESERSLIFEIPYSDYLTDKRLWWLSKESMEKGELDKYAEENFKKPKRDPVDKQLASDLVKWRNLLFEDLQGWNSDKLLSNKQFADSVQKILNRLVFIRTTEDRKIEGEKLRELARNWAENKSQKDYLQGELKKLFGYYWDHYDSKLFKKHICDTLEYEDNLLAQIINESYKNTRGIRYDFASINADVLGSIYEQYLGQIQQEETEKKSGKRKSQGIYYTPRYIVEYIVKNTLGELLKGKSGHEASKIKILDPACGSGSFLIKAFEVLDNHIRRENNQENAHKITNYARKVSILTSNIYGVDLDEEAVEIAQLNLLLKALEHQELLPNLSHNIECGNSLISGSSKELEKYFGKNWKDKKPFNWKDEFKDVFKQEGFSVIIGNPPYIKEYIDKSAFDGLHDSPYYQGKMDIWTLFACVAIDLLQDGGCFSFIAPNNWLTNAGSSIFRDKILQEGEIINFIDFGDYKVFPDAGIQTMIFVFRKCKPRKSYKVKYSKVEDKNITEEELISFLKSNKLEDISKIANFETTINFQKLVGNNITFVNSEKSSVLQKIKSRKNFELTDKEVGQGIVAAPDKYFLIKSFNNFADNEKSYIKKYYTSSEKFKGGLSKNNIFYISSKNFKGKSLKNYPNIQKHFEPSKEKLREAKIKYGTPDKPYFYLHRERDEKFFQNGPKIICGVRVLKPSFYFTEEEYYGSRALNFIKTDRIDLKYLTGILNSNLVYFWLKNEGKQLGDLLQIDKGPLSHIPICLTSDKNKQKEIIALVEKITKSNKALLKLHPIMDEKEYEEKKTEIEKTDKEIDEKVYELYGLSEEERKVVEGK
ncbi:MAG: N-6 DNA methylase [Patescibacteria group bacterium]|nr:N-6 DNA methylase [Patescibacteria group bacterium]